MQTTKNDLNRTVYVTPQDLEKTRKWFKVDASGKTLGKLATQIAMKLSGKHKAHYNSFWDTGDFVVVENCASFAVTGKKMDQKIYYKHTRYRGHLQETKLADMLKKHPEDALYTAVRWMLPKNKLRDIRMKRLKLFVTTTTKFDYLSPETLDING